MGAVCEDQLRVPRRCTVIDALVDEYATEHNVQNEPLAE